MTNLPAVSQLFASTVNQNSGSHIRINVLKAKKCEPETKNTIRRIEAQIFKGLQMFKVYGRSSAPLLMGKQNNVAECLNSLTACLKSST